LVDENRVRKKTKEGMEKIAEGGLSSSVGGGGGGMPPWVWALGLLVVMALGYAIWTLVEWTGAPTWRIGRLLKGMDIYKSVMQVTPVLCDASDAGLKVCDYYAAGASRAVFPGPGIFDFLSSGAIGKVLAAGARWIELDIWEQNGKPIVTIGNSKFNFRQTMNVVDLDDALTAVATQAWNPKTVPNDSDPIFLSLNIISNNTTTINNTAASVKTILRKQLLDATYSFQAKNIAQEPLCNLKGKCVIVSGGDTLKGTDLDELVNLSWSGPHLRRLTLTSAEETYDHEELTDFNRQNLTMVVPDPSAKNANKDPSIVWSYGCQAVLVNYSVPDESMEPYISQFQTASFVPKPEALRMQTPTYPSPTPQNPVKSFQPIRVTHPMYDVTV
jgi:hypothetical protein